MTLRTAWLVLSLAMASLWPPPGRAASDAAAPGSAPGSAPAPGQDVTPADPRVAIIGTWALDVDAMKGIPGFDVADLPQDAAKLRVMFDEKYAGSQRGEDDGPAPEAYRVVSASPYDMVIVNQDRTAIRIRFHEGGRMSVMAYAGTDPSDTSLVILKRISSQPPDFGKVETKQSKRDDGFKPGGPIGVYFFDEKEKALFVDMSDKVAPFTRLETGGEAVRAFVFACGECGKDEFIGYLEKFTPEYKDAMRKLREAYDRGGEIPPDAAFYMEEGYSKGRLIKRVGDEKWVESSSVEGIELVKEINARCEGKGRLRPCYPGQTR